MTCQRRRTSVLVLLLSAVILVTFMPTGVQANWLILHPGTGQIFEPEVTIQVTSHSESKILIPKETNLEILCAVIEPDATAPIKVLAASTIAHGHLVLKTCKTWQNGILVVNCTPVEPILAGGLSELVLHHGENYLLFKPLFIAGVEQNFAQVKFKSPCALPSTNNVKGSLVMECGHLQPAGTFVHLDCKNHEVMHLIRQAPEALFQEKIPKDEFRYGTKIALLAGIQAIKIQEPALYASASWGGHV